MSHRDGRVTLSAWVDPTLRDYARVAARRAGLEFSQWVSRALHKTLAEESAVRALQEAARRGECEPAAPSPAKKCTTCGGEGVYYVTGEGDRSCYCVEAAKYAKKAVREGVDR